MRTFPFDFAIRRKARFFPEEPETIEGDVLEIGPGRGDYLLASAQSHPNERYVGIEIKNRRFRKLTERVTQLDLHNVLLIHGDARIVVEQMVPPATFQRIYVLFPDPWPKRRHEHMRLLNREYLESLSVRLRAGGELIFATDDSEHLEWVRQNASRVDTLGDEQQSGSGDNLVPAWSPTMYEQRWREEGRSITYVRYCRLEGA